MKKIHLWLALPAGIFITLICLTGAVLVFEKELTAAFADPSITQTVSPSGKPAKTEFFRATMQLHRWLMLPDRAIGRVIVGVSTIFFMIILISGIQRWWRSRRYTIRWNAKPHRRFLDHHKVWGIYASVILLVCALTGLMWSFEWYRGAVGWLFDVDPENRRSMMRTALAIHSGSWGGSVTKILYFAAAIIGASLPVTGYWLYFKKSVKWPRPNDKC